jgi:hypothetical protein
MIRGSLSFMRWSLALVLVHLLAACEASSSPDTTSSSTEPEPGTFVKLAELQKLHDACARDDDPSERCAMLHAVFDFGEVTAGAFAQDVETFFR